MDFVDITDSTFSLGNSITNDVTSDVMNTASEVMNTASEVMNTASDVISNPTNWLQDISESIPNDLQESIKEVIPVSIHIDDENSIFIYIGIGVLIILIGIFAYNYYNKNKQVTFNEVPDVCYPDPSSSYCIRSDF